MEHIEVLPEGAPAGRWQPSVGPAALAVLSKLSSAGRDVVRDEAVGVLSHCLPPTEVAGRETGIVVGYVQSGKTASYTTVAALARDNGYGMVVVITGISKTLFRQSTNRLRSDLGIRGPNVQWLHLENPSPRDIARVDSLRSSVGLFRNPQSPRALRRTVLITVMKYYTHLDNLAAVLRRCDLTGVPVLVIDDEADQAGLNTLVAAGEESPTHSRLAGLRDALPHHSYLQYTATPQAPLLISLIDALSPSFAAVITPGEDYTGGLDFFGVESPIVRPIPPNDVPSPQNPIVEPPSSLLGAMRSFILGVAVQLAVSEAPDPRSMLIHPSERTAVHADFENWARSILRRWEAELGLCEDDPDRAELESEFAESYRDLARTAGPLPPWEQVLTVLPFAVQATNVQTINAASGSTPEPEWGTSQVLVGGKSLERGVTVEGLTVTYMPRGAGGGNADTIQQRARWFGYKADYLGYCRVHLVGDMIDIYRSYIEHEESMRQCLSETQAKGISLPEWRRRFFLDPALQPTRRNVIALDYMRGDYSDRWFRQESPHLSQEAVERNRELVQKLGERSHFEDVRWGSARSAYQTHGVASDLLLTEVLEELLVPFAVPNPSESLGFQGLLLQVESYLEEEPDARCSVYLMRPSVGTRRRLLAGGSINELFQGRSAGYPGDGQIRDRDQLTVQLHDVTILDSADRDVFNHIPAMAVWVPRRMSRAWIIQTA